jgi:hypothetical protein
MMFNLKSLSREAVPRALEKAERYRLLNEPGEAESICLDVLDVYPQNQRAVVMLLLALTDRFDADPPPALPEVLTVAERLGDVYEHAYYTGIVYERRAKAWLRHNARGSGPHAYEWLRAAMDWYEKAEAVRAPGNDDALLRWNACARLIMRNPRLAPASEQETEPLMLE